MNDLKKKESLYKKIEEAFIRNNTLLKSKKKYKLEVCGGDIYPDYSTCENYQNVWIDDLNYIKISYINHNKILEKIKEQEIFEKRNPEKNYKFQYFDDKDLTLIKIEFKKEHILFALDILLAMIDSSIGDEDSLKVKIGEKILPIKVEDVPTNHKGISLDDYFVIIEDEDLLIKSLEKEIKDKMSFDLIITDWDSFYPITEKCFSFEHYDFDENYFYNKEWERIKNLKKKN